MSQIFFLEKEKIKLCDKIVNKSNKVKLLVVKDSIKNEESVCCEQSNKMNFRLMNYFTKIKVKNKLIVKLNNCFHAGEAIQK